jgi:hypothetical protein
MTRGTNGLHHLTAIAGPARVEQNTGTRARGVRPSHPRIPASTASTSFTRVEAPMQTLSQSLFLLAFVLPPIALILGVVALAVMPRRVAKLPAATPPQEAAYN